MGTGNKQSQLDFFRREPVHETKVWVSKDKKLVVEHRTLHIFPINYIKKIVDSKIGAPNSDTNTQDVRKAE